MADCSSVPSPGTQNHPWTLDSRQTPPRHWSASHAAPPCTAGGEEMGLIMANSKVVTPLLSLLDSAILVPLVATADCANTPPSIKAQHVESDQQLTLYVYRYQQSRCVRTQHDTGGRTWVEENAGVLWQLSWNNFTSGDLWLTGWSGARRPVCKWHKL